MSTQLTANGVNMANGPLALLPVVVVLGHAQDRKLSLQQMEVLHVLAQTQRQEFATLMHVQVVNIERYEKRIQNTGAYLQ
jgi:hypothetical protein